MSDIDWEKRLEYAQSLRYEETIDFIEKKITNKNTKKYDI